MKKPKKIQTKAHETKKPTEPKISLRCLADIYGLDKKSLHFAIAETDDGEDGFVRHPVVVIDNSDSYIDLLLGRREKSSLAHGNKQTFLPAATSFENGGFTFFAPWVSTSVSAFILKKHYGTAIIDD